MFIAACDGESRTNWEMQGGDAQNCYATRPCDILFAGITNIYSAVSPRQQLRPFRWAFSPTCYTASPSCCFIFVLYVGRVGAIIHTYTTPHRLFICVVSPVLTVESQRLFGSKQWNLSPLSPSLIRRRIWGEWELTCKKSRADGDYSAAGDLNACCSCLLLHRSRRFSSGVILALRDMLQPRLISVFISVQSRVCYQSKAFKLLGTFRTCWGFSCWANPEQRQKWQTTNKKGNDLGLTVPSIFPTTHSAMNAARGKAKRDKRLLLFNSAPFNY